MKNMDYKNKIYSFFRAVLLIGIAYIILLPLFLKFSTSLMTIRDFTSPSVKWIPREITLNNYLLVWEHMDFIKRFFNSSLLTIVVSVLQLISCTLVGYGLARFKYEGRGLIFALVIFTLIVPPQLIVTPMYLNFRFFNLYGLIPGKGFNLIDTYWIFILLSSTGMYLKNGLFIYIMRQFFKGMPRELEEAAYIDGAGLFKAFFRVMLPGAIPGL
ncbi:MAG: carbohydrate ABC transporter permease, partial [Bacillota bacterium]